MSGLFRIEAVASRRPRSLGDVKVAQPLSQPILTVFITAVVFSIGLLLAHGSYARKVTVSGFLSPDKGIVRVHAPHAGTVDRIHVQEGQRVAAGAPLITLQGRRVAGNGVAVDAEALKAIDLQLGEIETRRRLGARIAEAELRRLRAVLAGLNAEAAAIGGQLTVQGRLVGRLRGNYERMGSVADQGLISSDELFVREQSLLVAEQFQAELIQQEAAIMADVRQTALALERLPLNTRQERSELESSRVVLLQRKNELEAQQSVIITAPLAGTVSVLRAIVGESVDTRLPVLTVLPDGGLLEAHLFVPSRAIGFVATGQDVRLLYDAFDYRRYGVQAGRVSAVSASSFAPAETRLGTMIREPTYRVTVRIDRQFVRAHGRNFPLQAGMSLRADIVLEKRTLIEWLLEPLLSLRGRA